MEDKRNMVLAVVLAALILFGWPYIANQFFPTANPPATQISGGEQTALPAPEADPAVDTPKAIRARSAVIAESARIPIATPRLTGSINLKGARIDDIVLTGYQESIAADSPPIHLFSPAGTKGAYYAGVGWTGQGLAAPDSDTVWQASGDRLTPSSPVTLFHDNGQGQTFAIDLSIDENYMITARQTVTNRGENAVGVAPYGLINRVGASTDKSMWTIHVGPMGVFDGSANYDWDYDDLAEQPDTPVTQATTGGWVGFTDKYWLGAVIPDQKTRVDATMRAAEGDLFQANWKAKQEVLPPGKALTTTSRIFAGAKETALLDNYEDTLGIPKFDRSIDWGWFYWFEKPIFYLLDWLFKLFGNFGVAIIALTFIIRGLMFPIAQKGFRSMAQMRVVQPKMKEIQERHKEDKPRMQQEIMELYKREKVNPMAGCLPIFLQIPVFYALYKVLMLTIEMRHQPFYGWIKDLSAPDPAHVLNLFGLLPFEVPGFLGIGVLAILLGVSMWLQFRLNPQPMDDIQKQVFGLMPWVLMFVMAPFAAGLLLYWITSNILTIAQQKFLYSRYPGLKVEPAKSAGVSK
ncbi:MAG: membrane protein insertase YidC [Sphingomonadales bacterium]|nr:membrane protein insertase YidC [Sphingomonadales bacterium]